MSFVTMCSNGVMTRGNKKLLKNNSMEPLSMFIYEKSRKLFKFVKLVF